MDFLGRLCVQIPVLLERSDCLARPRLERVGNPGASERIVRAIVQSPFSGSCLLVRVERDIVTDAAHVVDKRDETVHAIGVLVEGIDILRRDDVVAGPISRAAHSEKGLVGHRQRYAKSDLQRARLLLIRGRTRFEDLGLVLNEKLLERGNGHMGAINGAAWASRARERNIPPVPAMIGR
jgi:hypothetical protein